MPPIPTTFDTDASALLQAIERRQNDLSTFQLPRLRTCTAPLVTQQAWAAEVREDIERLAKQIEDLGVLVDDQRTESARKELRTRADEHLRVLEDLRKDSRAAVLASKRAIDAQSRSQREELLRSPAVREKKGSSNEKVTEDLVMKANNDVTEALQRTIGLMQKELERGVLSTQLLESSTSTLASTSDTHSALELVLGTSRQLVAALEQTDWLDRVVIVAALVFFALVVLFVLKQRILDRGVRIAFWWTRFLPSAGSWAGAGAGAAGPSVGDRLGVVMGAEKGAGVLASVSASAASVAASSTLAAVTALAASQHQAGAVLSAETGTGTENVLLSTGTPESEPWTADPLATSTTLPEHVEL
ncbi:Sec20-domain-containing protein [Melanogaster broomeanus]|nr:Sec20-domain-containing protein [Melanogaster broomeanus]